MRIRNLLAGSAIAVAGLAGGSFAGGTASAAADHVQTLRTICEAKDGTWVPRTGWWHARCQDIRSNGANDGANAAKMICSMQMASHFSHAVTDRGTTNWVCL